MVMHICLKDWPRIAPPDCGFWSRLERGQSEPTLTSLLRIQQGLGVDSIETLLGPTASTRLGERLGPEKDVD